MNINDQFLASPQYSLSQSEKSSLLVEELHRLTDFHYNHCEPYRCILDIMNLTNKHYMNTLSDIPYLPVRLFKTMKLQSISDDKLLKVLTSSGTTSQQLSKVAIDRETSILQVKALASIITSFIGTKRLPMIFIDSKATLQNRTAITARGAGLLGLSNFGRDHFFALDDEMRLNFEGLKLFADKHRGERILLFGFTYMIWQYFIHELLRLGEILSFENAVLIHSGGWKKLQEEYISNEKFKDELGRQCGIRHVYNFYGMVEQVGNIYMECENGFLHAPNFGDILIRDYSDWNVLPAGKSGVIQTLSALPRSYPGHSLLTEDIGTIHGVDSCDCGRKGTYFSVQGRIPRAELRGCSDTHAYEQNNKQSVQL